jgi:hypothetical protein
MKLRLQWRAILATLLILLAGLILWIVVDLSITRTTDIRRFDSEEVARLDTLMWRSYYGRARVRLFLQLGEVLRTQYRLPFWQSQRAAYRAARAAFVFKQGRSRADYEQALPDLRSFYTQLREASSTEFDVNEAARLELEWWIVHRERERQPAGALERALAEAAAAMYRVPAERFSEYARLRAEAMRIRDTRAEAGGVSEEDWQRIDELLRASWRALHRAVNE